VHCWCFFLYFLLFAASFFGSACYPPRICFTTSGWTIYSICQSEIQVANEVTSLAKVPPPPSWHLETFSFVRVIRFSSVFSFSFVGHLSHFTKFDFPLFSSSPLPPGFKTNHSSFLLRSQVAPNPLNLLWCSYVNSSPFFFYTQALIPFPTGREVMVMRLLPYPSLFYRLLSKH